MGRYRLTDVTQNTLFILVVAACYAVTYITFVIMVVKEFNILHGYPRYAELLPGQFVSDRYTWGWYFLILNLARSFVFSYYLYTLIDLKVQSKRRWFERMIEYVLAFDVALWLFFLITSCFLCNNSFWPSESSLCNDELDKWCTVMGDSYPDRCPPALPFADQCDLKPNPIYVRWIFFHIAFTALDLLAWCSNDDMSVYVRKLY